ncbi:MAG: hypothetical protein C5B50_00140 [Verrucomicrobia bacterium]|nr:MAG: hypothetical protein C5B50_00140 [Verrucomicrobiota bacterium]
MQADAAIKNLSGIQVAAFGAAYISLLLFLAWFCSRGRPGEFRFQRVFWLTLSCLATSLPFLVRAYYLWPWDWQARPVCITLLSAVLAPLVVAITLAFFLKRREKHRL